MTRNAHVLALLLPCVTAISTALAQTGLDSNITAPGPEIRRIATASAVSTTPIGSVVGVRELPGGKVLVNDAASHRLLLLDSALTLERVVLDSASGSALAYGRAGLMVPYRADSTLFLDRIGLSMLSIDPTGTVQRIRSLPVLLARNAWINETMSDDRGRLIYRVDASVVEPRRRGMRVAYVPESPDSAFIAALDLSTRAIDTVGMIRLPKQRMTVKVSASGNFRTTLLTNPAPVTDEWAVLSDGTVAFVRGIDYRIEYHNAAGEVVSSAKIPFQWERLPDSAKRALVDSVKAELEGRARADYVTQMIRWVNLYRRRYPPDFAAPPGYVPPTGFAKSWPMPIGVVFPANYVYGCAVGEEPSMVTDARGAARPSCIPLPVPNDGEVPEPPRPRDVGVIPAEELGDFRPAFGVNAVRADMDGNLWILSTTKRVAGSAGAGGPIYDIVNRSGTLVDRLQVPVGYELAGFGRGGVVFLSRRQGEGVQLARVRIRERG